MKKNTLLLLTTFLASTAALATPVVGDSATYALNIVQEGKTITGTGKVVISAKTAEGYEITQSSEVAGETSESKYEVGEDDLLSDAVIKEVLANCEQYGGKLEAITVPAGKFDVCTGPNGEGSISIGNVPLGIVKRVDIQGESVVTLELKEFAAGK